MMKLSRATPSRTRAGWRRGDSLLRQRNELMFVGNMGKAAGFPVLFGLLDPLFAGRDEIPPDMPRAFQRVAAQKHHPRRLERLYRDAIAGPKNQQPRPFVTLACDLDFAIYQIDRSLFVI